MTRFNDDLFVRNKREAELVDYAKRLATEIDKTAAKYDELGEFPFEHFDLLERKGFFKLTVPRKYGGDEISLYEMLLIQEQLGKADASTALSVGWHLLTFLNVRETLSWPEEAFERICHAAVENGSLINILSTERGKGNLSRGGKPGTIARKTKGGYIITGEKAFASLAPILIHFSITAYIEEEDVTAEFLITKNEQVEVINTWNALGMRATGSHDIILHNVFVPESDLLAKLDASKPNRFLADGRVYSLEIPAVYLGIAGAARDYAVDFAKNTYSHSLQDYISEAAHIRQKLGEIELLYQTARHLLYSIASRFEQDSSLKNELANDVNMAKHVICNNAVEIVAKAMRIVGGRSIAKGNKLERLFRDVQCAAFNPPPDDLIIEQLAASLLSKNVKEEINV